MSRRGIRQRKRLFNYRFDFARHVHAEQLVEFSPQEGATELWEIANLTPDTHPIHIHLIQFQVIDVQPFKR